MRECCCKYFLLFLVKKMSFCLEFEKKDLLLHPSSRPGGGIGRRAGLKIQFWQQSVGSSPTFGTISRRALGFAAILLYKITTLPNGAVSPRKGSLSCRLFAYIHAHGRFGMLPKYCWASFFANDLQTEPGCNSHPGFSLPRSKKSIAGFCQLNLCHCVL